MTDLDKYFKELFEHPEFEGSGKEASGEWGTVSGENLVREIRRMMDTPSPTKDVWRHLIEVGEATLEHVQDEPYFYATVGYAYLALVTGPQKVMRTVGERMGVWIRDRLGEKAEDLETGELDADRWKALNYMKKAVELSPDNDLLYPLLACAYSELELLDDAIACLEKVKGKIPGIATDLVIIGDICLEMKDYPKAIEVFQSVLYQEPSLPTFRGLSVAYEESGDRENAIDIMERAIFHYPTQPSVYRYLAHLYKRDGQTELAMEHVRTWATFDPELRDLPQTEGNLQQWYASLG